MNVNNQMYRMFKEMKEGYANDNKDQMEHGARCWLDLNPKNPFPENSEEMEAFFQMQRCYSIWKQGAIDRKINHRKMIMWAEKLCSLNPRQPYHFDKKAEEEELRLAQEEQAKKELLVEQAKQLIKKVEATMEENLPPVAETVKTEEPQMVFGIIPEKKPWYKNIFHRRKDGDSDDSSRSD